MAEIGSNSFTYRDHNDDPEPDRCPHCHGYHSGGCHRAPAAPAPQAEHAKLPIDRPCSACSSGDTKMEYHDHAAPFREAAPQAEGTSKVCPNCNSYLRDIRLCARCHTAHLIDLFSSRGHEKVECKHAWHTGAAPAETARTFREQLEKDWMGQQKWLDFTNYLVHRLEALEMRETAGEITAEQFAVDICRELYDRFVMGGWQPEEGHGYVRNILEAFAKQRVEQAERENESLQKSLARSTSPCGHLAQYAICLVCEIADLERERDTLRSVAEENDRDYNVVCDKLAAAESELREMREALGRELRWHRFRNLLCIEGCVCDLCNGERLLARKAGS